MVDVDVWVYHVVVGGIDYYLTRKKSLSNMLITKLSECAAWYEVEWFAREYGFKVSTKFDEDLPEVAFEKDFVNGAFV